VLGGLSYCVPRVEIILKFFFSCFKHINEPTVLRIYSKFAIVSFWNPTLPFWEMLIILRKDIYIYIYIYIYILSVGSLLPFEDFSSILVSPG